MIQTGDLCTIHFYLWESRGGGRLCEEVPVMLEPPFAPFIFDPPMAMPNPDEGRVKSPISSLISGIGSLLSPKVPQEDPVHTWLLEEEDSLRPFIAKSYEVCEFLLDIPKGIDQAALPQFLVSLSKTKHPVSFEILADHDSIRIMIACGEDDLLLVRSQLQAYFPKIAWSQKNSVLEDFVENVEHMRLIEYCLSEEFMRPMAGFERKGTDGYTSLFGLFDILADSQKVALQVIFEGCRNAWAREIPQSVCNHDGTSLFMDAPDMPKLAKEKVSGEFFAVRARVWLGDKTEEGLGQLSSMIPLALHTATASSTNSLIPAHQGYEEHLAGYLPWKRLSNFTGMLLNTMELASLVHFPMDSIQSSKLSFESRTTKAAPAHLENNPFVLGRNTHRGQSKVIGVTAEERLRHTHIIGATGTGKSTLLLSMLLQDIEQGNGCALLDPHGDLVDSILANIPSHRRKDVLVIDPSDADYPVGLGVLHAKSEIERIVLSSDLVGLFRRLSTSWGDQMTTVLANAVDAFLYHPKGGGLSDLRKFLADGDFRKEFLKDLDDDTIKAFWQKEFPALRSNSVSSILVRLDSFLRPRVIRNMMSTTKGVDMGEMMQGGKIILVKLSQGLIGEDNAYLLGSLIVAKIQQAAQARQNMSKEERKPFFLYIDEFQYFTTPSMVGILSGARKFGLGLVLAHQDLQQLASEDAQLSSAVLSNVGTRICFRLGDADANRLEKGFSSFTSYDLQNLRVGQAIARVDTAGQDFSLDTIQPILEGNHDNAMAVLEESRKRYATTIKTEIKEEQSNIPPILEETKQKIIESKQNVIEETPIIELPISSMEEQKRSFIDSQKKKAEIKEHKYLQGLIKKTVETMGYRAIVEEEVKNPAGRVDVALYIEGIKIAIEVSVTTPAEYEVKNIQKCIQNGFDQVISLSSDKRHLDAIQILATRTLSAEELARVSFKSPEELFGYLAEKKQPEVKNVRGYRVRVKII